MIFRVKYRNMKGKVVSEVFQSVNKNILYLTLQQKGIAPLEVLDQDEGPEVVVPREQHGNKINLTWLFWVFGGLLLLVGGVVIGNVFLSKKDGNGEYDSRIEKRVVNSLHKSLKTNIENAYSTIEKTSREEVKGNPVDQPVLQPPANEPVTPQPETPQLTPMQQQYQNMTEEERFQRVNRLERRISLSERVYQNNLLSTEALQQLSMGERDAYEKEMSDRQIKIEQMKRNVDEFLSCFTPDEYQRFQAWYDSVLSLDDKRREERLNRLRR